MQTTEMRHSIWASYWRTIHLSLALQQ